MNAAEEMDYSDRWKGLPYAAKMKINGGRNKVYYTDNTYKKLIFPEMSGDNIFTVNEFMRLFGYRTGRTTTDLVNNVVKHHIPREALMGYTEIDDSEHGWKFWRGETLYRFRARVVSGVCLVTGEQFAECYFPCADEETWEATKKFISDLLHAIPE